MSKIIFSDQNIELEYTQQSALDSELILELFRGKTYSYIIKQFINQAILLFGIKIFTIKKTYIRTITNLISSWMFTLYASPNFNSTLDPFLPNNYYETDSLKYILYDLVKYDITIKNYNQLIEVLLNFLKDLFKEQLSQMSIYKSSYYYIKNINKYKLIKKEIIQKRDENDVSFYKFEIKVNFEIKDKKLNNILNNLLIPLNEYSKLKNNYNGDIDKMDEYIFIILFRYQLLGSNNHQLGVKNIIMNNLNIDYKLNFECFASSINSTFKNYCSIYYDVEKYFGSLGNYYNLNLISGTFGINPPYQKDIIEKSINKCLLELLTAQQNDKELTFIITIPIWDNEGKQQMKNDFNNELPQQNIDYGDFDIINTIKKSEYCKVLRMIPKEKFTYLDHNFVLLKNKTIQNTYVIILSSKNNINPQYLLDYDFS